MVSEFEHQYRYLADREPVFARLLREHGRPHPFEWHDGGRTGSSLFAAMTLHIVGQQISAAVAFTVYDRIAAAADGISTPEGVIRLGAERLRECGLSRAKAAYVLDLAQKQAGGLLETRRTAHRERGARQSSRMDALPQLRGRAAVAIPATGERTFRPQSPRPEQEAGTRRKGRTTMNRQIIRVEPLSTYLERWKAPTSAVTRSGDTIYVSGFPSFDANTGQVAETASIERQTELVLDQMKLCLETAGSSLDKVLKCNVYCTSVESAVRSRPTRGRAAASGPARARRNG